MSTDESSRRPFWLSALAGSFGGLALIWLCSAALYSWTGDLYVDPTDPDWRQKQWIGKPDHISEIDWLRWADQNNRFELGGDLRKVYGIDEAPVRGGGRFWFVVGGAALGLLTAIVFNLTWLRRRGAVLGVVWIAAVAWTAVKVQSLSLTWNADTVAQTAPEPSIRPGPIQGGVGATAPSNQSAPGGVPTRFYLDNRKTNLEILDKRLLLQEYQNLQSAKQHQRDLALQTESYADDYKRRAEEHRSEAEELHRLASALDSRAHEYAIDGNSQLSSETSDEAREAWSKATAHERDADTCRTQERRYRNEAAEYRRQQAAYEQRYQEIQSQL